MHDEFEYQELVGDIEQFLKDTEKYRGFWFALVDLALALEKVQLAAKAIEDEHT